MLLRKYRFFLVISAALLLTAGFVLVFSPAARAAVEIILSYNGVTVSIDPDTRRLIVSGNLDAVVEQTDHSVTIRGQNGEEAGAGIAAAQALQSVDVSELLKMHPDLVLPAVPPGYSLNPQAESTGGSLKFTWQDAAGHLIIYARSQITSQSDQAPLPGAQAAATSIRAMGSCRSTAGASPSSYIPGNRMGTCMSSP